MIGERGAFGVTEAHKLSLKSREKTRAEDLPLTSRMLAVLELMAEGKPAAIIAKNLGISLKTVKIHQSRIYKKLDVHSALEAVLTGVDRELLDLADFTSRYDLQRVSRLSERETVILVHLVENNGKYSLNKEIAENASVKFYTVKKNFQLIFQKLGVENRLQAGLVFLAARRGSSHS